MINNFDNWTLSFCKLTFTSSNPVIKFSDCTNGTLNDSNWDNIIFLILVLVLLDSLILICQEQTALPSGQSMLQVVELFDQVLGPPLRMTHLIY